MRRIVDWLRSATGFLDEVREFVRALRRLAWAVFALVIALRAFVALHPTASSAAQIGRMLHQFATSGVLHQLGGLLG